MKGMISGLGWLVVLGVTSVEAANHEVRLLFQPDFSQPGKNEFINQTPDTGFCAKYPANCARSNMFSVRTPIRFISSRAIVPGDGVGFKAPTSWRQVTVINQITQQPETVEVKIVGIGSEYILNDTAANLTGASGMSEGHRKLWGSDWFYSAYPCEMSGAGIVAPYSYWFFWGTHVVEAYCNKTAAFMIPRLSFDAVEFAYEMRLPNPLGMLSGLYTGSLTYTLGAGGDFEMAPAMEPNDNHLTFDFVLDVQHTLKVDLPPGGNKVSLQPEGGWQPWIDSGRKPARIYRDQPFHISASSRFKAMMYCNALGGTRCQLGSPTGRSTDVEVMLSLPSGINGPDGGEFKLGRLHHNQWIGPFQPTQYVDRKPGSLRFEIPRDAIDVLLRPGVNDTLTGYITVIWDSEA